MDKNVIREYIYNYDSKYEEGLISTEIEEILKNYPDINMNKFNDALSFITVAVRDEQIIYYSHDVLLAIICGLENRDLKSYEID